MQERDWIEAVHHFIELRGFNEKRNMHKLRDLSDNKSPEEPARLKNVLSIPYENRFLHKGMSVNPKNTWLHRAALEDREDIAKWLIDCGADVNARNAIGDTPLHVLLSPERNMKWREDSHKAMDVLKLLLNGGADTYAKNAAQETPLEMAQRSGNNAAVEAILEQRKGKYLSAKPLAYRAEDPIFELIKNKKLDAIKTRLSAKDFDFNIRNSCGYSMLYIAARSSEITELVMAMGKGRGHVVDAPADFYNNLGSVFQVMARKNNTDAMELLQRHGAGYQAGDRLGRLPLHDAMEAGSWNATHLLVLRGAETTQVDHAGFSPVFLASATNQLTVIQQFLRFCQDCNLPVNLTQRGGENCWSALDIAHLNGHSEMVNLIYAYIPDVDGKTPAGTSLHMLLSFPKDDPHDSSRNKAIEWYLNHGADTYAQDAQGRDALKLAEEKGNMAVRHAILTRRGVKIPSIMSGHYADMIQKDREEDLSSNPTSPAASQSTVEPEETPRRSFPRMRARAEKWIDRIFGKKESEKTEPEEVRENRGEMGGGGKGI